MNAARSGGTTGSKCGAKKSARPATSKVTIRISPGVRPRSEPQPCDSSALHLRLGRNEALVTNDLECVATGLGVSHSDQRIANLSLLFGRHPARGDELLDRDRAGLNQYLASLVGPGLDHSSGCGGSDLR